MIKLYLDFDGVILDTIDTTYEMLKRNKIEAKEEIMEFYKNLDWKNLISNCEEINNSISNIKKIVNSNLYDVSILTHILCEGEVVAKRDYLKEKLGNIEVITVDKKLNKCDVVECKNAILVDDYLGNLDLWCAKGGISIKFSNNGKKHKYITIKSLDELIIRYDEIEKLFNSLSSSVGNV